MDASELAIRKKIILLHKKGKSTRDIAYLLDLTKSKVAFWVKRYNDTGHLENRPRSGKPSKLTKIQLHELKKDLLDYAPERYGGESIGWTTRMAIKFVFDKFGITYSIRRMQELFREFGLSLITPRSEHYKASKLARNSFREEFKKNFNQNIWIAPSLISMKQHSD